MSRRTMAGGAALAAVRAQLPKGRIQVIGTPAEEGGGGKVKLIKAGVFKDVDCAMMIHGFDRTILHQDLLGIARGTFEFSGKASHASADPWEGVNALDAVIAMYHDQGHVALKTIGFARAVNVTLGLPIVRTSVAHGTAFDIAGTGVARPDSLIAALRLARRLADTEAARNGPGPGGADIIPFSIYAGRPRATGAQHFDAEDEL